MKHLLLLLKILFFVIFVNKLYSQNIVEEYEQKKNDSVRIGTGEKDLMNWINKESE